MKELKTQPVLDKINNYKHKWKQYVCRMDRSELPYAIMKYQPTGKRNPRHPLKRLLDCCIKTGTGHKGMMMMIMMPSRRCTNNRMCRHLKI
jgi:hypothetical protein